MPERWARCAGFGAYEVSTSGRVRQRHTRKRCGAWPDGSGYPSVSLQRAGKWHGVGIHLLVWRTFRGPTHPGYEVDHRNRRRNDPRLSNLREITIAQNRAYALHRRGRSRYRGVCWSNSRGHWVAQIGYGRGAFLGYFATQAAAARAYDRAARKRWGRFAQLNFKEVRHGR